MKTFVNLFGLGLLAMVVFVGGAQLFRSCLGGQDNLANVVGLLFQETQRRDTLGHASDVVLQRIELKHRLMQGLLAEKVSLQEAIVFVREQEAEARNPLLSNAISDQIIADSLMSWVQAEMWRQNLQDHPAFTRLQAERQALDLDVSSRNLPRGDVPVASH